VLNCIVPAKICGFCPLAADFWFLISKLQPLPSENKFTFLKEPFFPARFIIRSSSKIKMKTN